MIESYSRVSKFAFDDIYYLHKDGKYTIFHTRQGDFKDRKGINKVLEILKDEAFVFTDRSFVVNLRHIITFEDHLLVMRDGEEVPISIPQYSNVRRAVIDYWRGERK